MKIALALTAVALCATTAHAADRITEQRPVTAFSALELSVPYRVVVHAHGTPGVRLEGDADVLAHIDISNRGTTLVVRTTRGGESFRFGGQRPPAVITITAAALTGVQANGSGDVEVDQLGGEKLAVVHTGPGNLHASGAVHDLTVRSSGPGDLDLHALSSAHLDLDSSGPGNVKLDGAVRDLRVKQSGAGDLTVTSMQAQHARLQISGPGSAKLSGTVEQLEAVVSGPGSLEGKALVATHANVTASGPGGAEVMVGATLTSFDRRGPHAAR